MFKAIWMSDLHFVATGDVIGHDPRVRLRQAVRHINEQHGDADLCIISGDMVNRGTETDYAAVRAELDALAIPYVSLVGNHDQRDLFRQALPVPDGAMTDFVQYAIKADGCLLACLDTQKEGSDAGEFCAARSAWLRKTLETAGDTPVLLFMHHPPLPLGLPMQDTDCMENGEAFLDLISAYSNVAYMCIGHVHRPISGALRGIPYSTMRSVLYQAPAPRPTWDWSTFKPAQEAPNIGVLTVKDGDVNLQYEQFCRFDIGVTDP